MRFSAPASFIASGVLLLIGYFTVRASDGVDHTLLSYFPVLFGVQQGLEGIVWLGVNGVVSSWALSAGTYGFLVFAVAMWPALFAAAAWEGERLAWKQRVMGFALFVGALWALVTMIVLFASSVSAVGSGDHLVYDVVSLPGWLGITATLVYTAIGVVPLWLSSTKRLRILGWLIFVSGGITWAVETTYFVSLWCFWAAVISAYIYVIVADSHPTSLL
jgi:hypothetical protein